MRLQLHSTYIINFNLTKAILYIHNMIYPLIYIYIYDSISKEKYGQKENSKKEKDREYFVPILSLSSSRMNCPRAHI